MEYINVILLNQEKTKVLENIKNNVINKEEIKEDINYNIDFKKLSDVNRININPTKIKSIDMLKRLNKYC